FTLTKVRENIFIVDYISSDILGQFNKKHLWFIEKYSDQNYIDFIHDCIDFLGFQNFKLINQNIFSYKLAIRLNANNKIFDAWDNFLKFPKYQKIKKELEYGYRALSQEIPNWTTNSNENIYFFSKSFSPKKISLVKNGVKSDFLLGTENLPEDLMGIKKPIIGFGGKISYLLDSELINFITSENTDVSFVFVGQILDKKRFEEIDKNPNVFFLGDKKYSEYPNYVKNFDICIIPYNIGKGQHGGDSMKAYEYLLTGKKVVGTNGNGLQDLEKYIYIAKSKEEFSRELKDLKNEKPLINIDDYSWQTKAKTIINIFNN